MARRFLSALPLSSLQQGVEVTQASRLWAFRCFASDLSSIATQEDALNIGEVGQVSGVPEKHLHRKVFIYSPARTASQQGTAKTGRWKINFISTQKWENPLMGWTSTGDPYASVGDAGLSFDSREAAVEFAEKYGWEYSVKEPKAPVLKPKAYAENFKWKGPEFVSES
ncbi:hypothetical protein O6H91_09G047100 [Diphasiastrum complanatum]|uniref:Uncharacterized protein n=1 Tax=Diphasiastrum complanatum TaxID=34168 RepID=A0ACC2CP04_DIPCM|nr:hypothetical protein O6H91_09G047100 [Diphasiastrum complanatum]